LDLQRKKKEAIEIRTKHTQQNFNPSSNVDLSVPQVWARVLYYGQGHPIQLLRTQTSLFGHWLSEEETTPEKKEWQF
jgi:hypothetical protein